MFAREVMVIEVGAGGIVTAADVDNCDAGIVELRGGGLAPDDGTVVERGEHADGEKVVFVGAAGMSDDRVHGPGP